MRAEAAVGLDEEACSLLWDMRAFYEQIPIWLLIQAGQAAGVEPAVIKVCIFAYKCGRHLPLGGMITRALFAVCGMPAGCPWATMWVKVIMIRETDKLILRHPVVVLDFFIDDLSVGSTGKKGQVANILIEAARDLHEVIVTDWHSEIAADKGFVVASNQKLANELRGRLGVYGGDGSRGAANLGVDYTCGGSRRFLSQGGKSKARMSKAKLRLKRLIRLRRQVGVRVKKCYT